MSTFCLLLEFPIYNNRNGQVGWNDIHTYIQWGNSSVVVIVVGRLWTDGQIGDDLCWVVPWPVSLLLLLLLLQPDPDPIRAV